MASRKRYTPSFTTSPRTRNQLRLFKTNICSSGGRKNAERWECIDVNDLGPGVRLGKQVSSANVVVDDTRSFLCTPSHPGDGSPTIEAAHNPAKEATQYYCCGRPLQRCPAQRGIGGVALPWSRSKLQSSLRNAEHTVSPEERWQSLYWTWKSSVNHGFTS